jgi:para-aminobenzoate synthetase/4-amino-4-deoxychorismate lyase
MEIIAEPESSLRLINCGTIGFMLPETRTQFSVAIRTVLMNKEKGEAEYEVGGAIVWDSQPENKYKECLIKTYVLNSSTKDFDLMETMMWSGVDRCLLGVLLIQPNTSAFRWISIMYGRSWCLL